MKDSRPSLILYIIAGLAVILSKILNLELLMLIFKPMVVPAIYYYYLQTKTRDTNFLFSVNVWLFFVSDMILLIYGEDQILWVMGCNLISYIILIRFALADNLKATFNFFNVLFVTLLLTLLGFILFTILNLKIAEITDYYFFYLGYGVVLMILVAVSAFNYLSANSASFLHLCSMSLCILVSDLFYAIDRFIIELPILGHSNTFVQFLSYFFMVKYFNSRKRDVLKNALSKTAE
ncbi:MAG TPA: lysoplasmalogenase family protein [Flavobacterium sp.]|jgi:hypothetical protein